MFDFLLFDVGHGFCAYFKAPSGATILFDCGYDNDLQFYPWRYFSDRQIKRINQLILSHFDQDHVCGLPALRRVLTFDSINRNPTVPVDFLQREKRQGGEITGAMASAIDTHQNWTGPYIQPDWGGVTITTFSNAYPTFTDTNNLSVVTFLEYGGTAIVIPGDLESAGWEELKATGVLRLSPQNRNLYCLTPR